MTEVLLECVHCHRHLPESKFYKAQTAPGRLGRSSWCIQCMKANAKKVYLQNRDKPRRPKTKYIRIDADHVQVVR